MRGRIAQKILLIGKMGNLVLENKNRACDYLSVSQTTLMKDIKLGRKRKGYYVDILVEGKKHGA